MSTFPPDTQCWLNDFHEVDPSCTNITQAMVNFLNLTSSVNNYLGAYCNNPPNDDMCPFGYCSQSDIAGPLVRISAYISSLCLCILIFYSSESLLGAFWSQLLTVISLLITSTISIARGTLTRFHSIILVALVGSPVTLYLTIYAVRALYRSHSRIESIVGTGRIVPRTLVLVCAGLWAAFAIYTCLPNSLTRFSQPNCDQYENFVGSYELFFLPIVVFYVLAELWAPMAIIVALPIVLTLTAWAVVILMRWRVIYPKGWLHSKWFRISLVWRMVSEEFPFVHFLSAVLIPFFYWVASVESSTLFSNDNEFSLSFGQVLAVFVTIPPMYEVGKLLPELWPWFNDLSWVRYMTCRRQRPVRQSLYSISLSAPVTPATPGTGTTVFSPGSPDSGKKQVQSPEALYQSGGGWSPQNRRGRVGSGSGTTDLEGQGFAAGIGTVQPGYAAYSLAFPEDGGLGNRRVGAQSAMVDKRGKYVRLG